jgi:hypothetical protein
MLLVREVVAMIELKNYQWKNRLLLVFAPSPEDEAYQEQLELLSDDDALAERDLVLFHIFESDSGFAGETRLSEADVAQLQEQFEVGLKDFTVVLVGKDGTEKERWSKPIHTAELFSLIDQMPMRQAEMR